MRTIVFSPLGSLRYGASIRANYLIDGLIKNGYKTSCYEMGIASKHTFMDSVRIRSAASIPLLPSRFNKAEMVFFEGIPFVPNKKRTNIMVNYLKKAKTQKKKIVLDLYDDPTFQRRDLLGYNLNAWDWEPVRNAFIESADAVLFPSKSMMDYYVKIGVATAKRCHVVMNASDPSHFREAPAPGNCVIGLLTGFGAGRGLEMLIDAFASV